ncbi:hypothetical protein WME89_13605 [Sorangium sp. So ce321]|uniref:hypothetical protein n=1 Tax=Sorangium sp. So ce321 TaxID=3133300 RepID=UPI003F6021BF
MTAPPCLPLRRAAASAARPRSSAALARSLAAAALAASATGCLVISPPEYDEPSKTGPVLTAVFPPQHIPIHIVGPRVVKDLGVTVLSEDNGDPVLFTLYIDYGRRSLSEKPFRKLTTLREIEAGTIAGGQRPFTVSWDTYDFNLPTDGMTPEKECHTITLMASHDFNRCDCPADTDDMSSLTWQVINCDANEPGCPAACPALDCSGSNAAECLFCDTPEFHDACSRP